MNFNGTQSSSSRSGSTYIIVVGASMLLSLFMLASLMAVRIQRLEIRNSTDIQAAQLDLESGIELGLFHIRDNAENWRLAASNNTIGTSSIDVSFVDPLDGDLTDSDLDPVIINVTGRQGSAIQHARARLNARQRGYDSLQSAMHAGQGIILESTTITSAGNNVTLASPWISYGNYFEAQGVEIFANVRGIEEPELGESTIHGVFSSAGNWPKGIPSDFGRNVFNYYQSNGVEIKLSDLWLSDHNLNRLQNPKFDKSTGWEAFDCKFLGPIDGELEIVDREHGQAGPTQDVSATVYPDGSYQLGCSVYNRYRNSISAKVHLRIESANEGVRYFSTPAALIKEKEKSFISGLVKPTWTGELISADWIVTAEFVVDQTTAANFSVSDPILFDRSYADDSYVLRNALLTPANNPYGTGQTDEEGVYVVNCDRNRVIVANSRVIGTLVLLESENATLENSLDMRNYIYNYPALLVDQSLTLAMDANPLAELATGVNFNPQSASLSSGGVFVFDNELDDSYSSSISGLIYVEGGLEIENSLDVNGVVLVGGEIISDSATVNLQYNPIFYVDPPPGFDGSVEMVLMPGNIKRFVSGSLK